MLTKEEATQVALRTYEKYGHLTFALLQQQVFERPDNSKEIFPILTLIIAHKFLN